MNIGSDQAENPIAKALNMLKRIRRLDGIALISGGVYLHEDCPAGTDLKRFLQASVQIFERDHEPKGILLGFEDGHILFLSRNPAILCLFFHRDSDLSSIETGGNQFLNQFGKILGIRENPELNPIENEWSEEKFRAALQRPEPPRRKVPAKAPLPQTPYQVTPSRPPVVADKSSRAKSNTFSKARDEALRQSKIPRANGNSFGVISNQAVPPSNRELPKVEVEQDAGQLPEQPQTKELEIESAQSVSAGHRDEEWVGFISEVENLFTKVIGSAQARRAISTELEAMGLSEEMGVQKSDYLSFGEKLTSRIRDRKIRRLIENELKTLIKNQ